MLCCCVDTINLMSSIYLLISCSILTRTIHVACPRHCTILVKSDLTLPYVLIDTNVSSRPSLSAWSPHPHEPCTSVCCYSLSGDYVVRAANRLIVFERRKSGCFQTRAGKQNMVSGNPLHSSMHGNPTSQLFLTSKNTPSFVQSPIYLSSKRRKSVDHKQLPNVADTLYDELPSSSSHCMALMYGQRPLQS